MDEAAENQFRDSIFHTSLDYGGCLESQKQSMNQNRNLLDQEELNPGVRIAQVSMLPICSVLWEDSWDWRSLRRAGHKPITVDCHSEVKEKE
jgi:hypothetical protein